MVASVNAGHAREASYRSVYISLPRGMRTNSWNNNLGMIQSKHETDFHNSSVVDQTSELQQLLSC